MPLDRTWYDTLVEDDGTGLTGSIWDKDDVDALMDAVDAALAGTGAATEQTTTLTGTQNDFSLSGANVTLRCTGASPVVFTGFSVGGAAPVAGSRLTLINAGATTFTVRVAYQDSGSTAAYRVISPSIRGQVVGLGGTVTLVYDDTTDRWRVIWVEAGAPVAVAFSAGNFTGVGANTWTVDSGDVAGNSFLQEGTKFTWFLSVNTSTTGGTPNTVVSVALPNGFTVANNGTQSGIFGRYNDGAWATAIFGAVSSTPTILNLGSLSGANLASVTNTFYMLGFAMFLVD